MRHYRNQDISTILIEIFHFGNSDGWDGSLEELEEAKKKLAPFNVIYTNDYIGRWELKSEMDEMDVREEKHDPPNLRYRDDGGTDGG